MSLRFSLSLCFPSLNHDPVLIMSNSMTSPHGHVQPDEYVPSSRYSEFAFNDYETPVDRILLSDNPSSSNTTSAPQHTQGVGTLCRHCDTFFWFQERLARSTKTNSCFTLCCNNGKVVLPAPQETPNYLDNLLNPTSGSSSKKFRREIHAYNSMFAFTSMGAAIDHSVNAQPGSYVFKVNGYCHHLMGSLLPMDNRVRLFRHARQRFGDAEVPKFKLRLIGKRDNDSRQYDDPSLNDIGGLVVGDIGHSRSDRDIIIESSSGTLQRISKLHPKFMALHYPLLFPYGEDGFHTDIMLAHQEQQHPKKDKREKQESTLIKGGRLYQQFLVDAFVNVEEDRLDFIRANKENLRSEHYKGIHDAIARGDVNGSTTGKIILPSSLTGSPRYMINNYQDAMAICRCYGNPDLFITFTCNVKWLEIHREIKKTRNYQPEDKPDIIVRVFHSKLIDMMSFIKSGKPFGRTITVPKRGLPYTHLLVWLAPEFKFRSPKDVDSVISAEIPEKNQDPVCYEIVSKFMMHGPCGAANPKAQCMEKNKSYGAHINVEICCQSMLIKYLFKYVSKEADRCRMVMKKETNDEIQAYLNCRFICPYEAVWRLFQFPIHSRSPAVERLQVHLPLQHHVFFSSNESLPSVLRRPEINKTMLTEWFERNRVDFPSKYVWDARQKEWIIRSRGFCFSRIVYVHLAAKELYFLRMLLNHVKGAKSFEDLRQISGIVFATFQLACKALGLLGDDKEWSDVFGEAIPTTSSPQLRQLFVNIIMFCEVADPNSLFDQFWHFMHDDIEYRLRSSFSMLNLHHKLPMPNGRLMDEVRNKLLREELDYDLAELRNNHSLAIPHLNPCQKNIYDSVITSILQNKQALIFVHGHGGTRKTFLWHTIINRVRSEGLILPVVASSGIASLLLLRGRTSHSRFKIPLEVNENSTCEIKHNTHLSRLLEMTSLIVWDEAPMNNRFYFEALDRSLQDILKTLDGRRLNNPFGGKSILLGGDFRQILPEELRQFAEWILLISDGQLCDLAIPDDHDAAFIKIPCELQGLAHLDPFYFKERAIVTLKNLTVSEINNFILDIIPGHKYSFLSCDSIQTTSGDIDNIDLLYPIEFINQLDFNGVPQHNISLKIGTPIMLLRNLSPSAGLCNGTRLIVTQLAERIIEAQIITGQSLKIVGVFLKEQVFSHGQLYVALSRVTSKNGLKIISFDHEGKPSCYAKSIGYKDIIQLLPKG
ncbi:hypothetical protein POPTR_013G071501v4 [Populus trichocarpa]|uniref:Uncharacterized protein n=1 Tax=Populus trichocarpa TaxID=3694 RepID=A0ACC0S1X8_POPTR|nr:hypothetical protein POPTR_013G071501v4 [Populus trichocarpa]